MRFLQPDYLVPVALLLLGSGLPACTSRKGLEPAPAWQTPQGRDQVRLELAESLLEAGAVPTATQLLADLRAEGHTEPVLDYLQGRALYETGLYDEAEKLLLIATKRLRGDPRPYRTLGLLAADRQQVEAAIGYFSEAASLDASHAATWNNLGFLQLSARNYPSALDALQRAVSLDAGNTRFRNNLGFAQAAMGKDPDALRTFRSVANEADAQSNFALAKELAGDDELAHRHYTQALELNPAHERAREGLERLAASTESP